MPEDDDESVWESFLPWQRYAIKKAAQFFGSLLIAALIFGPDGTFIVFIIWVTWLSYKIMRYILKADYQERDRSKFEKSLWDDLKDLDIKLTKMFKPEEDKPPGPGKGVRDSEGNWIRCIICGKYANKRGRFCDEHDDPKRPFYGRPPKDA